MTSKSSLPRSPEEAIARVDKLKGQLATAEKWMGMFEMEVENVELVTSNNRLEVEVSRANRKRDSIVKDLNELSEKRPAGLNEHQESEGVLLLEKEAENLLQVVKEAEESLATNEAKLEQSSEELGNVHREYWAAQKAEMDAAGGSSQVSSYLHGGMRTPIAENALIANTLASRILSIGWRILLCVGKRYESS